ncbi:MAG: YdbH domain-containing protein [Nitrospinae bacterium]|nr:YdbH domain-containing protein [Nitrospinota bacterium]
MSDQPEKRQVRRLTWIAAGLLLLLGATLVAPFLLTTQLVRLALGHVFPANRPSVGSAALSRSGTLALYDLVLHDSGALAQQPLVTARQVEVAFGWAALLSRQIRRIHAQDVTVYARSNGPSPLSLLDVLFERSPSGLPEESLRSTLPLWIDTLTVQGLIHLEPVRGFVAPNAEWPLGLHMTMSGDRMRPARQFRVAIGEARQVPEQIPAKPAVAAPEPTPRGDAAFGLRADVDTQPAAVGTRVVVHRLAARQAALTIEADALRRYAPELPADLHGPIAINLEALDVSGLLGSGTGGALGFSGNIRLQDLSVHSPAGGTLGFALDRLTAAGSVEVRLDRWAPAALQVRDGVMQWATLSYRNTSVNHLEASWRIDSQQLMLDRFAAQLFGGHIRGLLAWDLGTHAMPRCEVQMQRIDMHAALANISPQHLDAEGHASGFLHLALSEEGELSGDVDLAFDGPGILRVGEIEEVRQMLVGNVGLALATLALHDLQEYPFKEGKLYLESLGKHSQLKITFVRQPRSEADVRPPHKEIINGQEVWVGSLVVPTIDMTIPITGTSLAEILSIVSGVHPRNEAVGEQPGK